MTATLRTDVEPADVLYDADLKAAVEGWCHRHGLDPNKITRLDAISETAVEVDQDITRRSGRKVPNAQRTAVLRFRYTVHTSGPPPWVREA